MASDQMLAGTPGFLRLPAELRNNIYGFCDSPNYGAGPIRSPHPPVSFESHTLLRQIYWTSAPSAWNFRFTALAQTCRTLRQEAFAFFLADVVLVLDMVPSSLAATQRALNEIPVHVLTKINTMMIVGMIDCGWSCPIPHFDTLFTLMVRLDVQEGGVTMGRRAMYEREKRELEEAASQDELIQAFDCDAERRLPRAVALLEDFHRARTTGIWTGAHQKTALERLVEAIDGKSKEEKWIKRHATVVSIAASCGILAGLFYHAGDLAGDMASMVVLMTAIALLSNGMLAAKVLWEAEKPGHRQAATGLAIASAVLVCGAYLVGDVAGDITSMVIFLAIITVVSRLPGQRSDVQLPRMLGGMHRLAARRVKVRQYTSAYPDMSPQDTTEYAVRSEGLEACVGADCVLGCCAVERTFASGL
ncbi:hypothetical protein LTS10_007983 [Elasticomyces elasticus]|nr:hypothetical protein LTS10_007983 [Elasticomyces elasticus]